MIGAIGVVFGDIGTSPLYAMREALHHSRSGGAADALAVAITHANSANMKNLYKIQ